MGRINHANNDIKNRSEKKITSTTKHNTLKTNKQTKANEQPRFPKLGGWTRCAGKENDPLLF